MVETNTDPRLSPWCKKKGLHEESLIRKLEETIEGDDGTVVAIDTNYHANSIVIAK